MFTQATPESVPYLEGSYEIDANIHKEAMDYYAQQRVPRRVRLLQLDVAIKDKRVEDTTGWVFGVFVFDGRTGKKGFDGLRPLGLMWGNDPGITPSDIKSGTRLKQSFINDEIDLPQRLGWAGRLNGPVDNPMSSCLSCHSTAQFPKNGIEDEKKRIGIVPPKEASDQERLKWFRNIKSGEAINDDFYSLDYSLQMETGIKNFYRMKKYLDSSRVKTKSGDEAY